MSGGSVEVRLPGTGGGGGSGDVATDTIFDAKGDLPVGTAPDTATRLPVGTNGQVLTADSAAVPGVKWATPSAGGSVATDVIFDAKGDLPVGTAADTAARLPVGTDGQVLTADSAAGTGVKWATPSGGGGSVATDVIFDAKGDLPVGTGADASARLAIGADGQVLIAASGQSTGMAYAYLAPRWRSGYRYIQDFNGADGNFIPAEAYCYAVPVFMPTTVLDRIGCDINIVGASGAVIRLGIYNDAGGYPGTVLLDAGTVSGSAGTGLTEVTISQAVTIGLYWVAIAVQGVAATRPNLRSNFSKVYSRWMPQGHASNGSGFNFGKSAWAQSSVSGALGTWSGTTMESDVPIVSVRAA